jgi:hypothetical protein
MVKIKKGLFIGINYTGQSGQLYNCINDAVDMQKLVDSRFGIIESVIVTDNSNDLNKKPTKKNILDWFNWLVKDTKPGDVVWLHYSGHGSNKKDSTGDEDDNMDETIIPSDYKSAGIILDDDINNLLCLPIIANGAFLFFHNDCCHSATMCDLKYTLKQITSTSSSVPSLRTIKRNVTQFNPISIAPKNVNDLKRAIDELNPLQKLELLKSKILLDRSFNKSDNASNISRSSTIFNRPISSLSNSLLSKLVSNTVIKPASNTAIKPASNTAIKPASNTVIKPASNTVIKPASNTVIKPASNTVIKPVPKPVISVLKPPVANPIVPNPSTLWQITDNPKAKALMGNGLVISWSGCKDDQTSSDGFNGMANGAMTGAVKTVLLENKVKTWGEFLLKVRELLQKYGFDQIPQLTFNKMIDPNKKLFEELL